MQFLWLLVFRGVTIRVPHDTIPISIQRSRYNTYLDTYLNTVRCQRDVMSSMKAETPVIRSPAHNLLLQWMEYLLLQLPMLSQDVTLLSYIRVFPSIWSEKNYVFQLDSYKNTCVYSFLWIAIHWVCRIDTNRSDKISMHRDAPVNRYTPVGVFQFLLFTTSIPNVLQYLQKYSGPYKVLTVWSLMISIWNYIPRCIHKTILKQS